MFKDIRARIIRARVELAGYDYTELANRTGINRVTLYNRFRNPDSMTLGELKAIDQRIRFDESELIKLVRG